MERCRVPWYRDLHGNHECLAHGNGELCRWLRLGPSSSLPRGRHQKSEWTVWRTVLKRTSLPRISNSHWPMPQHSSECCGLLVECDRCAPWCAWVPHHVSVWAGFTRFFDPQL